MKRLSFLLGILLLLSSFGMTACKEQKNEDTTPVTTAPEVTVPEVPVVYASISREQMPGYDIVVAKSSSEETDQLTRELQQALQNALGQPINLKTENAYNTTQYEILIGQTNREESATFFSKYDMTWRDYGYAIVGEKLVIAGVNEEGTIEALRAFLAYVNKYRGDEIFFSNANLYLVTDATYPYKSLTINGISVKELSIVCNTQSLLGAAYHIRDYIIKACGIAMPIVTDEDVKTGDKLIVIGNSAHVSQTLIDEWQKTYVGTDCGYIGADSNTLWLNAKTTRGFWAVAQEVAVQSSGKGGDAITFKSGKIYEANGVTAMSFNLMAGIQPGDKRVDRVIEMILNYRPSVIGVQEATDTWIALLKQRLGDVYTVVGVGRNADGGDEHSAIFYLTEEFDCLESGTKWLSDTPDVKGTKFEASHYPRIMTYALLSRKGDGKQFLHVNTHLDYVTKPEEEATQVAQINVLLSEIAKFSNVPTIITGDFNATADSLVYQSVTDAGYRDAIDYIPAIDRAPTYHALMGTTGEASHIDFIFSKGIENGVCYRICTERIDNENVSDHYPVFVALSFRLEGK